MFVDIKEIRISGDTLLHLACESGNKKLVKWLVEEKGFDAKVQGKNGKTPIACACNEKIKKYLTRKIS